MSSVGSHSELLNVLGDVKARVQDKLGLVNFPMPQFIVVGKQSVGKSRLLEALAGETFNFVSGTLGSRRPTILEFRNVTSATASVWYVRDRRTNQWERHPLDEVVNIVGAAHEELGESVSSEPVHVRVESPACVDMQLVDLPGFRDFARNSSKQSLSDKISELIMSFMRDKRNVILCVEQEGDAATMSTLAKCREIDPSFRRTILIRNKLDKYMADLTPQNATKWIDGFGDLPPSLLRFALTLPHWQEGMPPPPNFVGMREEKNQQDLQQMQSKGLSAKQLKTIGFRNFAAFVEKRIEHMFTESIGPVIQNLNDLKVAAEKKEKDLETELNDTDANRILSTTRACGVSFATALTHVMGGILDLQPVMDMEEELRAFHDHHQESGSSNFSKLPSAEFVNLADYVDFLRNEIQIATFDVELNGGAQFRRLMNEVEIFLRFSEISEETQKRDVIQARGMSMASMTWRDVVVKLLSNEAHSLLLKRIQYVGERIKWFFEQQKEAVLQFMDKLEGTPSANIFSPLYPKHAKLLKQNEMIKTLVFNTYDAACKRQLDLFVELFDNTLTSAFSNPWVFLTGAEDDNNTRESESSKTTPFPGFEHTKEQIPKEIQARANVEKTLSKWLQDIPTESNQIDEAVGKVQTLVMRTYGFIRSQVCDQVELFAESFFKFPMLRQLEEDMALINLSDAEAAGCEARRKRLRTEIDKARETRTNVAWCVERIQNFKLNSQLRGDAAERTEIGEGSISRKRSAPETEPFNAPTPQRARVHGQGA